MNPIPVYQRLINCASNGFSMLEPEVQQEIRHFIIGNQDERGAFTDRAGKVDWYYTLFGCWLVKALHQTKQVKKLAEFAESSLIEERSLIDRYAKQLVQQIINPENKTSDLRFRELLKKSNADFTYKLFLFLLLADAQGKNKRSMRLVIKTIIRFYQLPGDMPSSFLAVMLLVRGDAGLKTAHLQKQLMGYYESGFKAFKQVDQPDLLSTAVSLFALHETVAELRVIAPACFDFIQDNYSSGAFLAGTGDNKHDLEYTFYGLLALGCLAQNDAVI